MTFSPDAVNGQPRQYHNQDQYLSLLAGLPAHLSLFSANKPPVSRLTLEQRLKALEPHHRFLLSEIEGILQWGYFSPEMTHEFNADGSLLPVEKIKAVLAAIEDHALQTLVRDKIDFRTLVGALRQRHQDVHNRPQGQWTVSRFKQNIENNWQEPCFRLEHAMPWLTEAKQFIDSDQPLALEKLLMKNAWLHLSRPLANHGFSFYAVVIYVLKWNIVERWSRYDGDLAVQRFDQLLQAGLSRGEAG